MAQAGISGDDRILSSYIDGLAARALGISRSIMPRVPALFEPVRAMPGVLDARYQDAGTPEDTTVDVASGADGMNIKPGADSINHPLARDSNIPGTKSTKSKNDLSIEPSILEHANQGGLNDQATSFEQSNTDRKSDELEDLAAKEATGSTESPENDNLKSSPNQAAHLSSASGFSRVNRISGTGTSHNSKAPDRNSKGLDDKSTKEASKEVNEDVIEEGTKDTKAYEHASKENQLSNIPSPNIPSPKSDHKQTMKFLEDIDAGTSPIKAPVETRVRPLARPSDGSSVIEVSQSSQNPGKKTEGNRKRLDNIEDAKAYGNADMGNEVSQTTSSESDSKQTITDVKGSDTMIIKSLIEGTPAFKSSKMSIDKPQMRSDAPQAPETIGPPAIKVTIGRIEVKAVLPPDKKVQRPSPKAKSTSLESYLLSIRGGSG